MGDLAGDLAGDLPAALVVLRVSLVADLAGDLAGDLAAALVGLRVSLGVLRPVCTAACFDPELTRSYTWGSNVAQQLLQ